MPRRGIYKRGNICWIRYAGLDGQEVRESSHSSKLKDAEALLIQRKNAVQDGKNPIPKKIRKYGFADLVEEYRRWAGKQRSYKGSKSYVITELSEVFGNLPLRSFNTMVVEQYQSEKIGKGYKPATVNRYLSTLKHMFTKAVDWEMVEEDTLKRVRKVKLLAENNSRLRYLSPEECQKLIGASDKHLRPILITALNTGMRKGEILSLRWEENIDLKHGFILLQKTKNGEKREIPINDALDATLRGMTRRLNVPYVFYGPNTRRGEGETKWAPFKDVKRSFQSACRKAGIKDFHFHDLRHTFASQLVMNGIDIVTVKELLGHKSLKMTLRYAHLAPGHKAEAVNILCEALAKKQGKVEEQEGEGKLVENHMVSGKTEISTAQKPHSTKNKGLALVS